MLALNRKWDFEKYSSIITQIFSKIHFILAGDKDETSVRTFADPHRKILQRGGIDAFIMTVPR